MGDDAQTPDDYVRQLSATTGMPHVLVRRNMEKIRGVLADIETRASRGLTRGLDLSVLDAGIGDTGGHALSFIPRTPSRSASSCPATRPACTRCGCPRSP